MEAAEDTMGAEETDGGQTPGRPGSPQPGPSTSGGQPHGHSGASVVTSLGSGVVRSSRGKRLPWRDPDYNDTSDSEEDEVSVPASAASPASAAPASASGVIAVTSLSPPSGGLVIQSTSSRAIASAAGRYFSSFFGVLFFYNVFYYSVCG